MSAASSSPVGISAVFHLSFEWQINFEALARQITYLKCTLLRPPSLEESSFIANDYKLQASYTPPPSRERQSSGLAFFDVLIILGYTSKTLPFKVSKCQLVYGITRLPLIAVHDRGSCATSMEGYMGFGRALILLATSAIMSLLFRFLYLSHPLPFFFISHHHCLSHLQSPQHNQR